MSDLYTQFTEHLTPLPGEDNIKKGGNIMSYSKKAKAADANAEEKKDLIQVGQVKVTRASELDQPDDKFKIMFDIIVRGVAVQGMCFQSYTNVQGEKGDMITFPSYKAKNGKYYNHAWFPITKELKDDIIKQIDSLIG